MGKERVDLEVKDYVVLQKPQDQVDRPSSSSSYFDNWFHFDPHTLWTINFF
jgi:hypothetical protein